MKNINMNKFRAFGSALDLQKEYNVIEVEEIEKIVTTLYDSFSSDNLKVTRIGHNRFEVKFIIEENEIEVLREDADCNINNVSKADKAKEQKQEIEKELESLKSNYKSIIAKNASLTKELNKYKRLNS